MSELAASQHGVFSRSQAAAAGVPSRTIDGRIAVGRWKLVGPGVLALPGLPSSWRSRLWAAGLAHGGIAVLSHRSAAALHGLDGCLVDVVEVTVPPRARFDLPGVVVHRTATLCRADVIRPGGLPVTSLARTLVDLGAVVDDEALERAVDDALRRGLSERTLRATLARLYRPGPSGTQRLARVLDRPGRNGRLPESWFERLIQRELLVPGLPEPVLQHEVVGPGGRVIARLDLAYPDARLGIEAHSRRWHDGFRAGRRDAQRDNALAAAGWDLIYVLWGDHQRPGELRRLVERALAARASPRRSA